MNDTRVHLAAYAASLLTFVALDAIWLSLVAVELFKSRLGDMLRPEPWLAPVAAFYLVYALGITVLAVRPALAQGGWMTAVASGAVLGLTAYATFDLTNLAVLRGWTWDLAILDIAWGVVGTSLAAVAGYGAGHRAARRVQPAAPAKR